MGSILYKLIYIVFIILIGCDAPKDFVVNQVEEQIKTLKPFTDNCLWHGGVYNYIVNDGSDHVICNDGAEFDIERQDTLYTDLFR